MQETMKMMVKHNTEIDVKFKRQIFNQLKQSKKYAGEIGEDIKHLKHDTLLQVTTFSKQLMENSQKLKEIVRKLSKELLQLTESNSELTEHLQTRQKSICAKGLFQEPPPTTSESADIQPSRNSWLRQSLKV